MPQYQISPERSLRRYRSIARLYDMLHHLQTLWSDDIHRDAVVKYSELKHGDVVLDVGTGTCLTAIRAAKSNVGIYIVGVDKSEDMLKLGRENLNKNRLGNRISVINADLACLPFPVNYFDKIISAYGMGGVQNPELVMEELIRVAKPNAGITMAEMASPPPHYKFRRVFHKTLVEPWIKFFWEFRDLDLQKLYEKAGIHIDVGLYFRNRIFGSTVLLSGHTQKE